MRRLVYDSKTNSYVWNDWIPHMNSKFGNSCVQKKKYISDRVRINNQEVTTGNNRTALYTMPGGVDNGVRYSALYEHSGLDITEINAVKQSLESTKKKVEKAVKEEMEKQLNELPKANVTNKNPDGTPSE